MTSSAWFAPEPLTPQRQAVLRLVAICKERANFFRTYAKDGKSKMEAASQPIHPVATDKPRDGIQRSLDLLEQLVESAERTACNVDASFASVLQESRPVATAVVDDRPEATGPPSSPLSVILSERLTRIGDSLDRINSYCERSEAREFEF